MITCDRHGPRPRHALTSLLLVVAASAGGLAACGSASGTDQPAGSRTETGSAPTGQSPTASGSTPAPTPASAPAREPHNLENLDVQGLAVGADGSVFVADATDSRILRVSKAGKITHFAGVPGFHGFDGDGGPARDARLFAPVGLAADTTGNLYVTDHVNGRIRKIDRAGIITTVAGSDHGGFAGDGGPATKASLQEPVAVAVEHSGRIYIADRDNNRVRAVDPNGTITTLAGDGSTGPDRINGPAADAAIGLPVGVAAGPGGVVYVADEPAHRVYRVGADGMMTTFAGTGRAGYSGDGGPATEAEMNGPYALTTDAQGNVYIVDFENHVVRVVDRKGTIRTVAGTGTAGFGRDGSSATKAALNEPYAVAVDLAGALYIAVDGNRVRRVDPGGTISTILP